jgi:hypothetical protein
VSAAGVLTVPGTTSWKCEVAHTSLLIGRASLLIGRSTAYAVVRRSSKNCPAQAGLFYAARIILYPSPWAGKTRHNGEAGYGASMQKAPSRITGPFGRSSIGGEYSLSNCTLTPAAFLIRHALIWFQKKCARYISGRLRSQNLRITSLLPLLIAFMLPHVLLLLVWLLSAVTAIACRGADILPPSCIEIIGLFQTFLFLPTSPVAYPQGPAGGGRGRSRFRFYMGPKSQKWDP